MNNLDFWETKYQWLNTLWDVMGMDDFVLCVDNTIDFLENSDEKFLWESYGDKIRFVFSREHGISEFLKNLRDTEVVQASTNIKHVITIILTVQSIQDLINNYAHDVAYVAEFWTFSVIDQARNDYFCTWIEEDIQEESLSTHERITRLLEENVPVITTEWEIVVFANDIPKQWEINVWDVASRSIVPMDRHGNVILQSAAEPEKSLSVQERAERWWLSVVK